MESDEKKYGAITLDTVIFTNNGYQFDVGLLGKMKQFLDSPTTFVISEINYREVLRHVTDNNKKFTDNLNNSLEKCKNNSAISGAAFDAIKEILIAENKPEINAKNNLERYIRESGASIIGANIPNFERLLEMYFSSQPPFENGEKKKYEFPDAIALLSLEQWGKEQQKKIIAVSKDKGWHAFANQSEVIDIVSEIDEAMQLLHEHKDFQEFKHVTNIINKFIDTNLLQKNSVAQNKLYDFLSEKLGEKYRDAEYNSFCHVEMDELELSVTNIEFIKKGDGYEFSIVDLTTEMIVVNLDVAAEIEAKADFSLEVYDSIDKDYTSIGGNHIKITDKLEGSVLITFIRKKINHNEEIFIEEIELSNFPSTIDFGYIEPNYSNEYYEE